MVSARSVRRLAGEQFDELAEVPPQQRLAAGQPDLVDAEADEDVNQPADLLEVQEIVAGEPDVLLLRHAVFAPEVAAVRDRHTEAAERPAQRIDERHSVHYDALRSRDRGMGHGVWGTGYGQGLPRRAVRNG